MSETHIGSVVFEELNHYDHEQVVFCRDRVSGLRAIIGIHSTVLGPALGGCRMYPYKSEREAFVDVLRLSRGMTYKASIAGLNLGGGKSVIIGDPRKDKSEILWRAMGRFIEGLHGRYITAEDSGTSVADMEYMRMETRHVVGISRALGGRGDPSPVTALGVFSGIRAAVEEKLDRDHLKGLKVAVQGVGHVGMHLVRHLSESGAKVYVADVNQRAVAEAVESYKAEAVPVETIHAVDCDVFAPCALGGALNEKSIPELKCKVVAGAANNQLANEAEDGARLADAGILYAPDFVVNAGGLMNCANELDRTPQERALTQAEGVYGILKSVLSYAQEHKVPTYQAANDLAMRRIQELGRVNQMYVGTGSTNTRSYS